MDDENAVAVVGIACRFPGADDTDEFWENLKDGKCYIDEVPEERWNVEEADVKDADVSWKNRAKNAALISDNNKWDNKFFGISDNEAEWMNPQHCLAMEVTHSALENAGLTTEEIKGSKTSVYIGAMNDDLSLGLSNARHEYNNFVVTGMAQSITSNRISYFYDFRGPSMTLDTACSSALVAVHLGCQSIRTGESEMAVCGGVNCILTPLNFIPLSKARMISPTGKSHAFSKDADGYVRGEGCGIVILKKYKKALEDNDRIWGLIATGCNQDGHTNTPITAPSGIQQQALLKEVYTKYGIDPEKIQYIEAHGTGTPVGDPIEVRALASFFAPHLREGQKIPIGSVKTNIGHLESSAGTAGLIKTVLMMHYGKFVPSLHFHSSTANPAIEFDKISLRVSTSFSEWNTDVDGKRIACVNSFGFGGTNCHAILVQQRNAIQKCQDKFSASYHLIALSGKSLVALKNTLDHILRQTESGSFSLADASFTSLLKRTHYRYRLSLVCSSMEDFHNLGKAKSVTLKDLKPIEEQHIEVVFLFCGVGTVWSGMCKEMLKASAPFQNKFDEIDKELRLYTNFSITDLVQNPPENLTSDPYIGPLLIFATQLSLFNVWKSLGIRPDVIIGQSVGEVAAAHAAGCLTLKDAVKLIYYRSYISAKYSGGSMMVVGKCEIDNIKQLCKEFSDTICIAVYSSKNACVVSGDKDAIEELKSRIRKSMPNSLLKELNVGCAYHSHHMDEACMVIEKKLSDLSGKKPDIPIISTVSGVEIMDDEMTTPAYWTKNLRYPVLLQKAILRVVKEDSKTFIIELGPKPVVKAHLQNITYFDVVSVSSMNQPNEERIFLQAVGSLYDAGIAVKWENLFVNRQKVVGIPRYKFNRDGVLVGAVSLRAGLRLELDKKGGHPFLSPMPLSKRFQIDLNPENTPYIYEHRVQGRLIAPGALHGEIGYALAKEVLGIPFTHVSLSLNFVRPLAVTKNQTIELQVQIENNTKFEVKRKNDTVCRGSFLEREPTVSQTIDVDDMKSRCTKTIKSSEFYQTLNSLGFRYGDCLSVIGNCFASDKEFIAEMKFQDSIFKKFCAYCIHPAVLDGALQTLALMYLTMTESEKPEKPIPIRIGELKIYRQMEKSMIVVGRLQEIDKTGAVIDLFICNARGDIFVEITNYEVKDTTKHSDRQKVNDTYYVTKWAQFEGSKILENVVLSESSLSVAFNAEAKTLLEAAFNVTHIVALPYDSDKVSPTEMVEVLFKYIDAKFSSVKGISEILFYPGLVSKSNHMKSEEIFVASKTSCVVLMYLLQRLAKENTFDIPFYILTRQTQAKTKDFQGKPCFNVIGSELWGMARCIMRERMFPKIYLLDFEKDRDVKHVAEIMQSIKNGSLRNMAEFKIENGQMYHNQMWKFQYNEPKSRMNSYSECEELEIRTEVHGRIINAGFVQKDRVNSSNLPPDTVRMKVSTGLVNSQWFPTSVTENLLESSPWKFRGRESHKMLFVETSGYIRSHNTKSEESKTCLNFSKVQPMNFSDKEEYITCFPMTAANIVDIPRTCIIPKALFSSYTPGILLEVAMNFLIVSEIDDNSPVLLYYDPNLKLNIELMTWVLNSFRKKLTQVSSIDKIADLQTNGRFQVIVLSKSSIVLEKVLTKLSKTECRVILHSSFVGKLNKRIIQHRFQNLSLKIINGDKLFSKVTVSLILKRIVAWTKIKKNQTLLAGISMEHTTLDGTKGYFSFQDTSVNSGVYNALDFPVHCSANQLFRRQAVYIIVGGLTGLGWEIATTIAKCGGGILILLGRSKPDEDKREAIDAVIKDFGCIVEYFQADVSDFTSLSVAFDKIKEKFPNCPIKGVFNGAAVVDDGLLPSMTEEKFDKVLRPKILGTWNLHLLTKDSSLDYFILHSSITSAFGNAGQTNYGAGNSFKDVTALHRRALGLPGQTINWGALKLGLINEQIENHLRAQGFIASEKELIIKCFLKIIFLDIVQVTCAEVAWENTLGVSSDMPHLFAKFEPVLHEINLLEAVRQNVNEHLSIPTIGIDELQKQSVSERRACILDIVSKISAEACAVELSIMKPTTTLSSVGLDSMKAMALINAISKHISCTIPVIAVLEEDATPSSIVGLILSQLHEEHGLQYQEENGQLLKREMESSGFMPEVKATYDSDNGKNSVTHLSVKNGTGPPELHWRNDRIDRKLKFSEILSVHTEQNGGLRIIKIQTIGNKEHMFTSKDVEQMDILLKELDGKIRSVTASTDL